MIALAATTMGVILSLPVAFLAASNTAPNRYVATISRYFVVTVRGVPDIVIALIFVSAVGLGPFAGAMALGIASLGLSAKLFMDAIEEVDEAPRIAAVSVGADRLQTLFTAVVPQAAPSLIGSGLYQLDVNIRESIVLGLVGAGGIGYLLQESIAGLEYGITSAVLIVMFVVVFSVELLAMLIRRLVT